MIARIWHGVTRAEQTAEYLKYLEATGIPDYKNTPGNQGVQVLQHTLGDQAHFTLISLWESYDAIRAFAGDDIERAYYYPEDEHFLLEKETTVTHHEWSSY